MRPKIEFVERTKTRERGKEEGRKEGVHNISIMTCAGDNAPAHMHEIIGRLFALIDKRLLLRKRPRAGERGTALPMPMAESRTAELALIMAS